MKNFDPLKTRAEQGLSELPSWQFSLSEQRSLLASRGLKQGVWTTEKLEVENDEPTLINGIDVRGDRKTFEDGVNYVKSFDPSPDTDVVTAREQEADNIRIGSRLKIVHEYVTRVK